MFICARDVHENCRNRVLKSGWHVPNIYRFYDISNANSSTNIGCAIPPTLMKLRQIFLHIHARLHNEHFYHGHCLLGLVRALRTLQMLHSAVSLSSIAHRLQLTSNLRFIYLIATSGKEKKPHDFIFVDRRENGK
jgi:hypothetical protein